MGAAHSWASIFRFTRKHAESPKVEQLSVLDDSRFAAQIFRNELIEMIRGNL
jgi:hypothetical protein